MSDHALFDCRIWSDPEWTDLSPSAMLLGVWADHNTRSSPCGLYTVTPAMIASETRLSELKIASAMSELRRAGRVHFDGNLLWAVDWPARHMRGRKVLVAAFRAALRYDHPFRDGVLARMRPAIQRAGLMKQAIYECRLGGVDLEAVMEPILAADEPPIREATAHDSVRDVFNAWTSAFGRAGCMLTDKRRAVIKTRLKRFSAEQLVMAIHGYATDPWRHGEGGEGPAAVRHELTTLLRTDDKVEAGIEMFRNHHNQNTLMEALHGQ